MPYLRHRQVFPKCRPLSTLLTGFLKIRILLTFPRSEIWICFYGRIFFADIAIEKSPLTKCENFITKCDRTRGLHSMTRTSCFRSSNSFAVVVVVIVVKWSQPSIWIVYQDESHGHQHAHWWSSPQCDNLAAAAELDS